MGSGSGPGTRRQADNSHSGVLSELGAAGDRDRDRRSVCVEPSWWCSAVPGWYLPDGEHGPAPASVPAHPPSVSFSEDQNTSISHIRQDTACN